MQYAFVRFWRKMNFLYFIDGRILPFVPTFFETLNTAAISSTPVFQSIPAQFLMQSSPAESVCQRKKRALRLSFHGI